MWAGIKKTYVRLVNDQECKSLLDHLFQEDVFTNEDCNIVRAESTRQAQNRSLLQILQQKSDLSHHKYVTALKSSGQEPLANLIWSESLGAKNDDTTEFGSKNEKLKDSHQKNRNHLSDKLQELFSLGECGLKTDIYPYLVCNGFQKPESSAILNSNFTFLHVIPWKVIFEFEELETARENSIYTFFTNNLQYSMNVHFVDEFDASKNVEESLEETVSSSNVPIWLFANGYEELDKPILSQKEWRRQYSEGFREALRMVCRQTPRDRVVVVFLLLSENYAVMLSTFEEFTSKFQDNWLLIAESHELCSEWKKEVIRRKLVDDETFNNHSVIGMPWSHINGTFRNIFKARTEKLKDVPSSTGAKIQMSLKFENSLTDLDILGSTDTTNIAGLEEFEKFEDTLAVECAQNIARDVEAEFYCGKQVSWSNFYFQNHVMRRDMFDHLNRRVTKLLMGRDIDEDQRVARINLYHQPAAGGTTLAREILWEHKSHYRCVVVKDLNDKTVEQIFELRSYEESHPKPMLLLLDNFETEKLARFYTALVKEAKLVQQPSTQGEDQILFVLITCFRKVSLKFIGDENTFKLRSELSTTELEWIHTKWEQLDLEYQNSKQRNPRNFISFNTLKENFSKVYLDKIVQELVSKIDKPHERILLKYISIVNAFDLLMQPLPISSFDSIMPEKQWERSISDPLRMLLNEVSVRGLSGNGCVRIINSLLAQYVFNAICHSIHRDSASENEEIVMKELLNSNIFKSQECASQKLLRVVCSLMKKRARKTSGMRTTFSPLIQAIIDDKKQSVSTAVEVLELVFQLSNDMFVAQQIARLYIHSKNWTEAIKYGRVISIDSEFKNSFLWHTYAEIFKSQLIERYRESREKNAETATAPDFREASEIVKIGFNAIEIFRWAQEISVNEASARNNAAYYGEIETVAQIMDFMYSLRGLDNKSTFRQFLIDGTFVPDCLADWNENLIRMVKQLPEDTERTLAKLDEESLQLTLDLDDESDRNILCVQDKNLMGYRECINSYVCESTLEAPNDFTPNQKCLFWRRRIMRLRGNTLKLLFDMRSEGAVDKLQEIKNLAGRIIATGHQESRDLQVYIGVSIVLSTVEMSGEINETELIEHSVTLYNSIGQNNRDLEPFMYAFMLNWPQDDETNKEPQFPIDRLEDVVCSWKDAFYRKYPRIREQRSRETTCFFLSQRHGMLRYMHEGQLHGRTSNNRVRNSQFWNSDEVSRWLKNLKGVLRHNGVRVTLWSKGNKSYIHIPTAIPLQNSRLLHKEVHFYLGFTWSGPKAYNVRDSCVPVRQVNASNTRPPGNVNPENVNKTSASNRMSRFSRGGQASGTNAPVTGQRSDNATESPQLLLEGQQFNEKLQQLCDKEKHIKQQIQLDMKMHNGLYAHSHTDDLKRIDLMKQQLIG